jgi:hypothetical protein
MEIRALLLVISLPIGALAQAPATSSVTPPLPGPQASPTGSYSMTATLPELDRIESAASQTTAVISRLKIDKWKTDGNSKRQAGANADSIRRNLSSALPGMISAVRSSPQDLTSEFRLYRNLNALYDVLSSLTESTGAFGPKNDYDALAQQLDVFDSARRNLGDSLELLTASMESQLDQLRAQVRTLQTAAAPAPPKKVVVDENEPAKKGSSATRKKKSPAANKPSATDSGANTTGAGSAPPAKPSQ